MMHSFDNAKAIHWVIAALIAVLVWTFLANYSSFDPLWGSIIFAVIAFALTGTMIWSMIQPRRRNKEKIPLLKLPEAERPIAFLSTHFSKIVFFGVVGTLLKFSDATYLTDLGRGMVFATFMVCFSTRDDNAGALTALIFSLLSVVAVAAIAVAIPGQFGMTNGEVPNARDLHGIPALLSMIGFIAAFTASMWLDRIIERRFPAPKITVRIKS